MKTQNYLIICFSVLTFIACNNVEESELVSNNEYSTIMDQLLDNYEQMPEQEITRSPDNRVYAQYTMPTQKYSHGILGDRIEAEQLVVVVDSVFYELTLSADFVFEDISPRLCDVDGDNELEFITIRTSVSKGAGIAIYKIIAGKLTEYASVPEIGNANRWLNIVAINDLDNDGVVELVWIQTPHIGGVLRVARIEPGNLYILDEREQYSNHAIGERNLCLSSLTVVASQKVFYVPNQGRDRIVGFTLDEDELRLYDDLPLSVDFSTPLSSQYGFGLSLATGNNCYISE